MYVLWNRDFDRCDGESSRLKNVQMATSAGRVLDPEELSNWDKQTDLQKVLDTVTTLIFDAPLLSRDLFTVVEPVGYYSSTDAEWETDTSSSETAVEDAQDLSSEQCSYNTERAPKSWQQLRAGTAEFGFNGLADITAAIFLSNLKEGIWSYFLMIERTCGTEPHIFRE